MPSDDYSNQQSLYPLSWNEFHNLWKGLVRACASYEPEVILPIARGGLYPGSLMAHQLRREPQPVRVSRYIKDVVAYAKTH